MAFEVNVLREDEQEVIVLRDDFLRTEVEIFSFGALLNSFSINLNGVKENVISGFANLADAKANITSGFKSAKLNPFVCRLKAGDYSFNNKKYHVNKFFLGSEAIHGLLYDASFKVIDKGADSNHAFVTLEYVYNKKDEGFPFFYATQITYTLEKNSRLSIATTVINKGEEKMPLSDGWHPYFKIGKTVNDLQLKFNSKQIVDFNDSLLPTGNLHNYNNYLFFEVLGETFFDNCFVLNDFDKAGCVIKDEGKGLSVEIFPDKSYPYLQIYTPEDRKSIAIENLSSAPDAFNNGMGLLVLEPGETKVFTTTYQIVPLT